MFKKPYTISVFISLVLLTLLTPPIILAFDQSILILGVPLLLFYIISLWALLVLMMLWLTSKKGIEEE